MKLKWDVSVKFGDDIITEDRFGGKLIAIRTSQTSVVIPVQVIGNRQKIEVEGYDEMEIIAKVQELYDNPADDPDVFTSVRLGRLLKKFDHFSIHVGKLQIFCTTGGHYETRDDGVLTYQGQYNKRQRKQLLRTLNNDLAEVSSQEEMWKQLWSKGVYVRSAN